MLIQEGTKVHLYCGVTDMRKSINTLCMLVKEVLDMDVSLGHLFLFRSRCGSKLKALYYEEGGFCLWYKRLDKGKFIFPRNISSHLELSIENLNWLLSSNKFVHMKGKCDEINYDFY